MRSAERVASLFKKKIASDQKDLRKRMAGGLSHTEYEKAVGGHKALQALVPHIDKYVEQILREE